MLLGPQLVEEARARRQRRLGGRERLIQGTSALTFLVAATAFALLFSSSRATDPLLMVGLVAGYVLVSSVRFEYAGHYVSAEQLTFVFMLVLLPVQYVPLLACGAALASIVPEIVRGEWHRQRAICAISDSWFAIGPALVVAALASGPVSSSDWLVYLGAFGAQIVFDAGSLVRQRLQGGPPFVETLRSYAGTVQVDAILSPLAFVVAVQAADQPLALLAVAPLVWLLRVFSQDRRERYNATVELNRAYRGTVMLLGDVVEFEDNYTGDHSRSVVELVLSVSKRMGIDEGARQEMEFAALLHDVGKISIPKEILHKPAKLTDEEFELMKTHTVEGQFLLDKVGGLLGRIGEIVRSCHERWDGKGYPDGLAGKEIPLAARIVFVCDAYNAMTTDRPYRKAMSKTAALAELSINAGTQFDPEVVEILIDVVQKAEPEGRAADDMRLLLSEVRTFDEVGAAG